MEHIIFKISRFLRGSLGELKAFINWVFTDLLRFAFRAAVLVLVGGCFFMLLETPQAAELEKLRRDICSLGAQISADEGEKAAYQECAAVYEEKVKTRKEREMERARQMEEDLQRLQEKAEKTRKMPINW